MPSDLIVNVRQISNYPELTQSDGSETILLQQGGLGGPYASISAQALVSTGLGDDGSMSVGTGLPGNVGGGNIFAELYVMPLGESLVWNAYGAADATLRYWNSGVMGGLSFSEVGYVLDIAPSGGAGQVVPPGSATPLFVLSQAGALELPHGTLTVARDPAAAGEVATLNYVSNNTVQSFNSRQGQVQLNAQDVYNALRLCDPLATQPWVNQAITNSLQNLLYTCPFVNTWNGRQGQVYLMLSDITCVFYQSGQQPISPTPALTSNDDSIATTKWVTDFLSSGVAPLTGLVVNGTTQDPNATANTALFVGTSAYSGQEWFPATSLWVPNGGLQVSRPDPYGASGLASGGYVTVGLPVGSLPQVQGGVTVTRGQDLATYPGRDVVAFLTAAGDIGPLLILSNVTFDQTHVYVNPPLTLGQVAMIQKDMVIDTNHTPKMTGLISGVAPDGSSITVEAWYQTFGSYVSAVTIVAAGTGYQVGDICTVMSLPSGDCARVAVTSTGAAGAVAGLSISYGGSYYQGPQTDNSRLNMSYPLYGGSGSGATVALVMTNVAADTSAGQNPQAVPVQGTAPPALKVWVSPCTGNWNRNAIGVVGGQYNPQRAWTPPWVEGGAVASAIGEEMDMGNYTGVYCPGNDGVYGDSPVVRGFEIANTGNARAGTCVNAIGDWQNGFLTYGQQPGSTAFGAYTDPWGWQLRIMSDGTVHLGAQRTAAPAPSIYWHTTGTTTPDAQIVANGGTEGTAYGASVGVAAAALYTAPGPAANNLNLQGALPGATPAIGTNGIDANVGLDITCQGTGQIHAWSLLSAEAGMTATQVQATQAGGSINSAFLAVAAGNASYGWNDTVAPADGKIWDLYASAGALTGRLINDANTLANTWLNVSRSGFVSEEILLAAVAIVMQGALTVSGAGGPTITGGAGAATGTQPPGSLWLRTDGGVGGHLYVSAGGGTWNAVAGV